MIFVTGGTGLAGSHLLYKLAAKGHHVRALKRASGAVSVTEKVFSFYCDDHKEIFSRIEWVEGDVRDIYSLLEAIEGAHTVYHCAAMVSFIPADADEMMKINIEGTANVVNACLEKKVKRFCHVSSVAALGDVPQDIQVNETFFWKGSAKDNHYAISKYGAEREAWRGAEEGLETVIVNPTVIIGPGNWDSSSCTIFREAGKGIPFYPGGSAGYVDARDVAEAMIRLAESEIKNERFIINAENISYRSFANMVHEALGKKKPFIPTGKFSLDFARRVEKIRSYITGNPPVLTKTIAAALNRRASYSSEKIRKAVQLDFIPIQQSIRQTAELFLKDMQG